MTTPCPSEARDVTEAVLDAMLNEALNLTDEIAAVGAVRRAIGAPDSVDCALRLRLAARLSRIAAWASLRVSEDPERLAIAEAALRSASAPIRPFLEDHDSEPATSELAPFIAMVDRIVERALRLDALLSGAADPAAPAPEHSQQHEGSAVILPFRRPENGEDCAAAERASEGS